MLLGLFLLVLVVGATLAFASANRIHRAVVCLVAFFVAIGAVIGSVPGTFVLIGLTVTAATGPSTGIHWALWTTLASMGTLAGIAFGAAGAGALSRPHVNRVRVRAASAALFALIGVGLSTVVLSLTGDTSSSALLGLLATLVTATSVLGFVVPRRGR